MQTQKKELDTRIQVNQLGGIFRKIYNYVDKALYHLSEPKDYTDEKPILRNGKMTVECAKLANDRSQGYGYMIFGDAWQLFNNTTGKKPSLKQVYNGFNKKLKPKEFTEEDYDEYISIASKNFKNAFQDGQINLDPNKFYRVGMYYKRSPHKKEAFYGGSANGEVNTHTGYIEFVNGEPRVIHTISDDLKENKLSDLLGPNKPYSVVTIYEGIKKHGGKILDRRNIR